MSGSPDHMATPRMLITTCMSGSPFQVFCVSAFICFYMWVCTLVADTCPIVKAYLFWIASGIAYFVCVGVCVYVFVRGVEYS